MAIGTDSRINFFGTQDELSIGTGTALIASGNWSNGTTDIPAWTNDDDADEASITFKGTLASAASAGKYIDVYVRKINVINTTDDDLAPDDDFKQIYLGSFAMDVGTAQLLTIDIPLPNYKTSSEYEFYINNGSGQQLNADWELWITPKTDGPHG